MMSKNAVQFYCRLRPMQSPTDVPRIRVTSNTTVVHMPPGSADNFRTMTNEEYQTTFNHVFTSDATQREIFETVALPLVENLISGRNGLLFTYGVTGSGKTYTITGKRQDAGILPRCLDAIFNTIANNQSKKFVSDKLNSFDVQNEVDAMLDRQHVLDADLFQRTERLGKLGKIDSDGDSNPTVAYKCNASQNVAIEPGNVYAVFVTYVEIYYNSVYDLLDENDTPKIVMENGNENIYDLISKIFMEDGNENMYELTFTEVEVKTAEEAFELFQRGQRKRRVAHTARTNAKSSSSHGVFTITLVQKPLDCESEHVKQDKRNVCVSQLSLVDFAGFEYIGKDFSQLLEESRNSVASVKTLRSYLEILREDQDTDEMDSHKARHVSRLFQKLFDWQGQARMILCVNPRADDYDNTERGMRIMEVAREVHIARDNPVKLDVGFTPGRRRANKEVRSKLEKEGRPDTDFLELESVIPFSLEKESLLKEIRDELRLMNQILVGDNGINPVIVPSKDKTPVSNPSYRRSQSADRWIDHRPQTLVPIGTVLQPLMQKRRIVTRLTSSKEITQDHGTDGGVETKLYKDDILPTSSGGSQVVFNDMECLKPSSSKRRKH